jgi:signal transduction histidine kinase
MQQIFAARRVALDLRIVPAATEVRGDPDQLTQVLINLLGNAAKFSPPGTGRAELSLKRIGDEVEIAVADNGHGIAPADRAIVFERFRQLGDTMGDKPRGVGLGLAITQRIVDHHGGRIWIETAPGGGALFLIRLPALRSARIGTRLEDAPASA